MLEYDFLKAANEYLGQYKDFLLPILVCDTSFEVYSSNAQLRTLYPHLAETNGLRNLLAEFNAAEIFARLFRDGSVRIDNVPAFGGVHINMLPAFNGDKLEGAVVFLVGSQAAISPMDVVVSSRTPMFIEKSIRESVEEIFRSLDVASLKSDMLEAGWVKPSLNNIAQSGYHLLRMATNISQYTSTQSQPLLLSISSYEMFELLLRSEDTVVKLADDMGIPLTFDLPEVESFVGLDPDKFQFAFFNVVHNALYYTKDGNSVTITGKVTEKEATVTVKDNGLGIPKDILPRIFQPYYSFSHDNKPSGIGLGLTLAKTILEAHRGSISVTSTFGKGTEVTLKIPRGIFSRKISLAQDRAPNLSIDRFSHVYVGLVDAARSPYSQKNDI